MTCCTLLLCQQMRRYALIAAGIAALATGCQAGEEPGNNSTVQRTGKSRSPGAFQLGVYLNSNSHPHNLQVSRMMADWARHGVNRVVMITYSFSQLAPQGLCTLAKQWGIELYLGNIWPPRLGALEEHERHIQALIDHVNSFPDSDAVRGWYAYDEAEAVLDPRNHPGVEKWLRGFVAQLHRLDPRRKVIVNHDARTRNWGGRFMQLGEDESWCSVFWANHYAEKFLQKVIATHRAAYGEEVPFVLVYGAQSINKTAQEFGEKALEILAPYGVEGLTAEEMKNISTREDIADYILTSHRLGVAGTSLFVYDGYYDYTWYSLVDERGQSKDGKMEGLRDAIEQIRQQEGWPGVSLQVQGEDPLSIAVAVTPNGRPVKRVTVEASHDGGHTWLPIPGFDATGGTVKYSKPYCWQRGLWTMIRARCSDAKHDSLWSVWNVFPAFPPNAS